MYIYTHTWKCIKFFIYFLSDTCSNFSSGTCNVPLYWYAGFLSLQSSIDAAVIEMKTNHSVWEEMKSISGVRLKSPSVKPVYKLDYIWFIVYIILCFSPYMYFLSVKIIREKRKLKVLMRAMGLQDIAFWLSWGLLYTVYISITATLLTLITITGVILDHTEMHPANCRFSLLQIHFSFMLSSLLQQPNIASFVGFVLHILFGLLGFLTLFEKLPLYLEWILNLFSPFAFIAGISQMLKLDKYGPAFTPELYPFFNLYLILSLDSVLYLLLAIYFDKVLPGKYGVPYPPLFFLRPSYWCKPRSGYVGVQAGNDSSHNPVLSNNIEPMPPGFDGKEAIRLNNIKKAYKQKDKRIEALRGLSLSIYEGQITALLGHSGSGKTALLNVLSGFSKPSAGSAMIYNHKVSEVWDMEGIQAMVGICPQLNLHFEALTVKENLRTFAHIKGIQQKEVEQEVRKVLTMLDLTDLQDVHADALSGGQRRKLSLGIAILGNPQVLLLDEPTAGLDPCSRHHVWTLLKERQAGRVTLFTTQSMEEADAHADRKAFLSNGRLQCVGSSLYLKRKWGVGYHLRMHINDLCDPELISSLVRQYIPNAVLKGQKQGELCYMLPLENTDSFPDLFSRLESSLSQGVVNYEVSRTTLEEVFLKLEGEEAIGQEGKTVTLICKKDGDLEEKDQSLLVFSEHGSTAVSGMELWRQQVCAVMRVRFFKLKHEGKSLRSILLFFGIFILPVMMIFIAFQLWDSSSKWEITASSYFLPTAEKMQDKSSNLLLVNDTGEEEHVMLIHFLHHSDYRFTVMCSAEPINCFPVLVNILSNTFLRLFNSTARFRVWSEAFYSSDIFFICLSYMLILAAGLPPHFAMSSMEDYKLQARAQLRLAGLFPSAYWCGQALVDVPLFWTLLCLMFGVLFSCTHIHLLVANTILSLQIICTIGYGASLVLLVYLIAFKFHTGRSNRYIWSFVFILVSEVNLKRLIYPYIHCVIFALLLRCLEMRSGGAATRLDPIFRSRGFISHFISSQESAIVVNSVRKEYEDKKASSVFKKRKKVAVKNLSFTVKKGEVLGLLGPNGAGKSTTINMISGHITATAGEVGDSFGSIPGYLGCCPQQDPLWPDLTVHQHLQVYAAVRGMRKEDAAVTISRIENALDLQKHLRTPARRLSAGEARKLCFALSILGGPVVMLWDEPSVATTFYKSGTSYHLEVKMTDPEQSDALHAEVLHLFPYATRQERMTSSLIYKIPMENAVPLSQSFSKLEAGKRKQSIRQEDCFQIVHMDLVFMDAFSISLQLNRISGLRITACHCTLCNRYAHVEITG
uniref:ABC transporter domain-containing protein n=1 Tax=Amazona collaria TaxID=241587 RepID=A0A8B9IYS3_9PSIT